MNLNFTANILGICSLGALAIAMFPSLSFLSKLSLKHSRQIMSMVRYGLLASVCLGMTHGLLMTQQDNVNFYDIGTYWTYAVGLFCLNLLIFLAFMYGELKSDFKKLSYFYYGAMVLLACHVGQIAF